MARQNGPSDARPQHHNKLPRLDPGSKIQKRPLPRRQQPASSKSHLVYVSSRAPFMATVKRVRKQLDRSLRGHAPPTKGKSLAQRVALLSRENGTQGEVENPCEVLVLGTGKAVEKTLSVASWFMAQGDCDVDVRTKTVGTVDDVVGDDEPEGNGFEEDSRVRRVSCLEVAVRLK